MRDPITAQTIAVLCGGLPIDEATALIEQYATVRASQARVEGMKDAYNDALAKMGSTEMLTVPHA